MSAIKKQYYGIKFPFTSNNLNGFFIDLNEKYEDKIASEIAHVLLTSKRSRIRMPEFGTDLIRYIFEPNNELTWENIREEAKRSVEKYVKNVELNDINVIIPEESPNDIFLDLTYSVRKNNKVINNRMAIKL